MYAFQFGIWNLMMYSSGGNWISHCWKATLFCSSRSTSIIVVILQIRAHAANTSDLMDRSICLCSPTKLGAHLRMIKIFQTWISNFLKFNWLWWQFRFSIRQTIQGCLDGWIRVSWKATQWRGSKMLLIITNMSPYPCQQICNNWSSNAMVCHLFQGSNYVQRQWELNQLQLKTHPVLWLQNH